MMTNRIVLLSSEGDELFSGSSLLAEPPPTLRAAAPIAPPARVEPLEPERVAATLDAAPDDDEEPVPETLRSSVLVPAHEPVSRPIVIEVVEEGDRAA